MTPAAGPASWRTVADEHRTTSSPVLVVHGNCQAEALRVLVAAALGPDVVTVRVPPVFELTAAEVDDYHRLLRRTDLLVTQPVVDDYRGLPLGTSQVTALLPAQAAVARVPVLRWAALMPTHAIVRAPGVGDPPLVPYHDLRVVAAAARREGVATLRVPSAGQVLAVREITSEQLRVRQEVHGTIDALPALRAAGADAVWTINHPQNGVLLAVARAALDVLGVRGATVTDPGRVLLGTTTAPLWPTTLEALGSTGTPRAGWNHAGRRYTEREVAEAQLDWYRAHPGVVDAALARHRPTLEALDLL